jgi:hypothetical protein
MRKLRRRHAGLVLLALVLGLAAAATGLGQGVTPQQVTVTLPPGGSTTVTKTVETTKLPPASDFLFLADTTGSMGPSIADVKANAQLIINAIEAAGAADARYAVANYRDTTAAFACNYLDELDTDFTNAAGAIAAINTWAVGTTSTTAGCDLPEAQLYALHQAATSELGLSWRTGAEKFIIWFGDAPGHEPICNALPGYSDAHASITEASATADLVSRGAHVIAVSVVGGAGQPGLDADPKPTSISYPPPCAADETGTAGQATRIAAATGGVILVNPPGSSVAVTIIAALNALPPVPVTVTPVATCDAGLTASFTPPSQVVPSGSTATFQEMITVTAALPGVTLGCTVDFLINGMNAGPAFRETIRVTVGFPESTEGCKVTQGGWIVTTAGDRANFGGNAHVPPKGHENYVDHGSGMHVSSIDVLSVVCSEDGTMASIFVRLPDRRGRPRRARDERSLSDPPEQRLRLGRPGARGRQRPDPPEVASGSSSVEGPRRAGPQPRAAGSSNPSRYASAIACERLRTPSFSRMCSMCVPTVLGLITRSAAISRWLPPRASSRSTSSSRFVSDARLPGTVVPARRSRHRTRATSSSRTNGFSR